MTCKATRIIPALLALAAVLMFGPGCSKPADSAAGPNSAGGPTADSTADATADSSAGGPTADRPTIQLQLNWFPEAEHGGYYQALIDGDYASAGIGVDIVPGGPTTPVAKQVGMGRSAFGIANADVILMARAQGVPIVGLMAPFQKTPRCIIVKESSPFQSIADIRDTKLVANNTKPFVKFLQDKYGLEGVEIVPYGGGKAQFLANDNYAIQGYTTSEPVVFRLEGYPVRAFPLHEEGFNPYASVLFTSEDYLKAHPEICARMVQASQKGWLAYLADPARANARITAANPDMTKDVLDFGGKEQAKLMLTDEAFAMNTFGYMSEARWQDLHDLLVRLEMMTALTTPVTAVFTTEFLANNPDPAAPDEPATTAPEAN